MRASRVPEQTLFGLLALALWSVVLLGCQPAESTPVPLPTVTEVTAIPIQDLMTANPALEPSEGDGATPAGNEAKGTPSIIPTLPPPTPFSGSTSTPTPVPEPTFYQIEAGDTFVGIAEKFDVSIDSLIFANGYNSLAEVTLAIGEPLQIPYCEVHQVVSGNTLSSIAQLCGLTMDDLIVANIAALASVGSLEGVPLGFMLIIPQTSATPEDLDCNIQPGREQVIEYTPGPGEGPFCLSQKFGVSSSAIIQSNAERLTSNIYGEVPLLIPPKDSALYVISLNDVTRDVKVEQLADWYEVDAEAISDWNGNPVTDPLVEGQQLLIAGANVIFGRFQSRPLAE